MNKASDPQPLGSVDRRHDIKLSAEWIDAKGERQVFRVENTSAFTLMFNDPGHAQGVQILVAACDHSIVRHGTAFMNLMAEQDLIGALMAAKMLGAVPRCHCGQVDDDTPETPK